MRHQTVVNTQQKILLSVQTLRWSSFSLTPHIMSQSRPSRPLVEERKLMSRLWLTRQVSLGKLVEGERTSRPIVWGWYDGFSSMTTQRKMDRFLRFQSAILSCSSTRVDRVLLYIWIRCIDLSYMKLRALQILKKGIFKTQIPIKCLRTCLG